MAFLALATPLFTQSLYFRVKFQPVKFVGSCEYPNEYSDEAMAWVQLYLLVKRPMVVDDSRSSPNRSSTTTNYHSPGQTAKVRDNFCSGNHSKNVPKTGPGLTTNNIRSLVQLTALPISPDDGLVIHFFFEVPLLILSS